MKSDSIISTVLLCVAIINQVLAAFGKSPLPIENETLSQFISAGFLIVTSVISWWKNNSVTKPAQLADKVLDALKAGTVTTEAVNEILPKEETKENTLNIIDCIFKNNRCYKATHTWNNNSYKRTKIKGIVVHDTADGVYNLSRYVAPCKTDENYDELIKVIGDDGYDNNDWNRDDKNLQKCPHAMIGKLADGSYGIIHTLPYEYPCWLCGGSYNADYLQFETLSGKYTDTDHFQRILPIMIDYTAYLVKQFDIPIENIVSHQEAHKQGGANDHDDCDKWFKTNGYSMKQFREAVKAKI